jgi:phage portal protein BeeE
LGWIREFFAGNDAPAASPAEPRLIEGKAAALDPATSPALQTLVAYPESRTGISVNWLSTLKVTTALRCVSAIANGIAMVPLKLYRPRADGGSDVASDLLLYWALYRRPNPWQTSFQFRQTMIFHLLLAGRFAAFKNVVNGEIRELIPFRPEQVEVIRNRDLSLRFVVTGDDRQRMEFPAAAMWYITGPSWDSWSGLDAVRLAREAIGLSLAANGRMPSCIGTRRVSPASIRSTVRSHRRNSPSSRPGSTSMRSAVSDPESR